MLLLDSHVHQTPFKSKDNPVKPNKETVTKQSVLHKTKLNCMGPTKFCEMCQMHHPSFVELCSPIDPLARKNTKTANAELGPITTEIALCTVAFAGWLEEITITPSVCCKGFQIHLSVHMLTDVSMSSTQSLLWDFVFHMRPPEVEAAAQGFQSISSHNVIKGCVASVNGLLIETGASKNNEVGDAKAFFSGHWHTHDINMHAVCDQRCWFVHIVAQSPGDTGDCNSCGRSNLADQAEELAKRCHVVGDNERTATEHLLTPSNAVETGNCPAKQCHNQCPFQCRVRIEMAFGWMVGKWRMLQSPLNNLTNAPRTAMCIARLHNFCINQRQSVPPKASKGPEKHCLLNVTNSMVHQ